MSINDLYRRIPSVNDVLLRPDIQALFLGHSRNLVVDCARSATRNIRLEVQRGSLDGKLVDRRVEQLGSAVRVIMEHKLRPSLRRVLNATGVVLHTNLGRAPLSSTALSRLLDVAGSYSNLELDLNTGQRWSRDRHVEALLLRVLAIKSLRAEEDLLKSHSALIVNNCAGATFLALNSLADGKEVIVSRGELVEIGGGFRIPDILRKSGAILREVGTTNRTNLSDYQAAITDRTGLLLRVHESNFRMIGFTKQVPLDDLVALGRSARIPVFEDQGTGLIADQALQAGTTQTSLVRSLKSGVDLLAASGDKLFGGPQCGFLIGSTNIVEELRCNPLLRTLRVCKLTYSALEGTLLDYVSGNERAIPILRMLSCTAEDVLARCEHLARAVNSGSMRAEVTRTSIVIGGGTAPRDKIKSFAVALSHESMSSALLAGALRMLEPAIVGRLKKNVVLLELRTVPPEYDTVMIDLLLSWSAALSKEPSQQNEGEPNG